MEELVRLLNEYEIGKEARDYTWRIEKQNETRICWTQYTWAYIDDEEAERIIISKKYWFIKRLIKNDKIDTFQLAIYIEYHSDYRFVANRELRDKNVDEDHLLMLLSISDTPIEDLVSYLR